MGDRRREWKCACGHLLGVFTATGLRLLVSGALYLPDRIEVRCPQCRRGQTFHRADLAA